MAFLVRIPTENARSSCILPNGAQLLVMSRLRSFAGFWTIQFSTLDASIMTDECPLIYNPNLFKQYTDFIPIYGIFSVEEDYNPAIFLEESLNNTIRLYWDYPY
jgi:hypothetical protein